jgi:hypothetical protein
MLRARNVSAVKASHLERTSRCGACGCLSCHVQWRPAQHYDEPDLHEFIWCTIPRTHSTLHTKSCGDDERGLYSFAAACATPSQPAAQQPVACAHEQQDRLGSLLAALRLPLRHPAAWCTPQHWRLCPGWSWRWRVAGSRRPQRRYQRQQRYRVSDGTDCRAWNCPVAAWSRVDSCRS